MSHEPLDQYTDAQIGAAARDVMRDCGKLLQRLFNLQPLLSEDEGASVEVPAGWGNDFLIAATIPVHLEW